MNLVDRAWEAREKAYAWRSGTKVGCAIRTDKGNVILGWNTEGLWQTSIHAEVCAISQLSRNEKIIAIAIASETSHFTPCGACLDWIFQFGRTDTEVFISDKERTLTAYSLASLMPYYPEQ